MKQEYKVVPVKDDKDCIRLQEALNDGWSIMQAYPSSYKSEQTVLIIFTMSRSKS